MIVRIGISLLGSVALALAAGTLPTQAETPARFTVTDLGTLGGARSEAHALNERGEVAGWSDTGAGARHAFLWKAGALRDLPPPTGFRESLGLGLNDQGQVVGAALAARKIVAVDTGVVAPGSVEVSHAALWEQDAVRDLGPGEARDINNRGDVVGRRYLWRGGRTAVPVTTDAQVSEFDAQSIAEDGTIGGTARPTGSAGYHPALLRENRAELLDDFAGGPGGVVNSVNRQGEAVGMTSRLEGEAFHWLAGKRTFLGTMNGPVKFGFGGHAGYHYSQAFGVNDPGQVVGAANVSERGLADLHAFLWEKGTLTDLNRLIAADQGWVLQEARAINHRGQICGSGTRNGACRAFLLTPRQQ